MNCTSPIKVEKIKDRVPYYVVFPCGQCLMCRINKRRSWVARNMLEHLFKGSGAMVTLTYNDENLPLTLEYIPTLKMKHIQKFQKLYKYYAEKMFGKEYAKNLSFHNAREYGECGNRPHYHVLVHGSNRSEAKRIAEKAWKKGFIHVGDITPQSIEYVCGYISDKIKKEDENYPSLMPGQEQEGGTMSRRPGLGYGAIQKIAEAVKKSGVPLKNVRPADIEHVVNSREFEQTLRFRGKKYPWPRYVLDKVCEFLGGDTRSDDEKFWQQVESFHEHCETYDKNAALAKSRRAEARQKLKRSTKAL